MTGFSTQGASYFLSESARDGGTEVSRKGSWSAGVQYDFGYRESSPWYWSFAGEFSDRSFNTSTLSPGDTTALEETTLAYYLDVRQGLGWYQNHGNNSLGVTFYIGAGVPLWSQSPRFSTAGIVQGYAQLDFNIQKVIGKNDVRGLLIGISPYLRAYLKPLYEPDETKDREPYIGFGAILKVGYSQL